MSKVDAESAKLALMELAEAFGVTEGAVAELLPVAMEGRLFLREDKAVYVMAKPVPLKDDKLDEIVLREPVAKDYVSYSKGMSVSVSREGVTEIDAVMMTNRTMRALSVLGGQSPAIIDLLSRRDLKALQEVCDALGFFE